MFIKALSIWPPHSDLIAMGAKSIETREWKHDVSYRGWILICASQITSSNKAHVKKAIEDHTDILYPFPQMIGREAPILTKGYKVRSGVAVAIAYMNDCRAMEKTEEESTRSCISDPTGLTGLYFSHVHPIHPFPVKGAQGIFSAPYPSDHFLRLPDPLQHAIRKNRVLPAIPSTHPLLTWGYEGRKFQDLQAVVEKYKVGLVADVRRTPYSQNPDFCEEWLKINLDHYHAFRWLGNQHKHLPWEMHHRAGMDAEVISSFLQEYSVLLICKERNVEHCHRQAASHYISSYNGSIQINHLP